MFFYIVTTVGYKRLGLFIIWFTLAEKQSLLDWLIDSFIHSLWKQLTNLKLNWNWNEMGNEIKYYGQPKEMKGEKSAKIQNN